MKSVLEKNGLQEITSRIESLNENNLRHWGKMDVHQMLEHCTDSLRMGLGELYSVYRSPKFVKWIIKAVTLSKMQMPKNSPTAPELVKRANVNNAEIENSKKRLLQHLNQFIHTDEKDLKPYPAFGKMTKEQYGKFYYKHLDHHLRQFGA